MRKGDITEFGEVSFVEYDKCYVQFCDPGGKGIYGVHSMTYEEILQKEINKEFYETRL